MNNVKKQSWGQTTETFRGLETDEYGKRVYCKGTNTINPEEIIPLHVHEEDNEDYIPVTSGVKIIVVPKEEVERLTGEDVSEFLLDCEAVKIGEIVTCKKGYAHALYNSSDKEARVDFIKYY